MIYSRLDQDPTPTPEPRRSRKDFLCTFFSALDRNQVRYCVLHSWDELPERLASDLDIAVHPEDARKLSFVFRFLGDRAYTPVQVFNHSVGAYCFQFLWFEGPLTNSLAVDAVFEQKGTVMVPAVELLVSTRRRHGMFWITAPESEFRYLLAKKTCKGTVPARQERRLRDLVEQLGRPTAERLARELFLGRLNVRVVEACASEGLGALVPQITGHTWKASLARNPLRLAAYALFEALRRVRRWLRPTGLFVVIMGPDGAGKSTLIEHLVKQVGPAFRRHRVFHWRPMLLWRRKATGDTTRPHSCPPHPGWLSVTRLCVYLLDYWLGYWLVTRPLVVRSGLVLFDRYYDDMLIDPKRYRYGGPLRLARTLRPLVPKPDLVLILDAPTHVVLSRKQEVAPEELQRQRRLYAKCVTGSSGTRAIDATGSVAQVAAEAGRTVIEYLSQRFERQHARRLAPERDAVQGQT